MSEQPSFKGEDGLGAKHVGGGPGLGQKAPAGVPDKAHKHVLERQRSCLVESAIHGEAKASNAAARPTRRVQGRQEGARPIGAFGAHGAAVKTSREDPANVVARDRQGIKTPVEQALVAEHLGPARPATRLSGGDKGTGR